MQGMTVKEAMQLAISQHNAGHNVATAEICRDILRAAPERSDAMNLLGIIAWQEGRGDEAVELIGKAIAISPQQPAFRVNLGSVLMDLGKLEEALAAFSQVLMLDPNSAIAHHQIGRAMARSKMAAQAVLSFKQALNIQPRFPEAHFDLANTLREMGVLEESIESYRAAIAQRPNWPEAHSNLGNSLVQLGRMEEGIGAYRTALALRADSVEIHNNLGNAYFAQADFDRAMEFYGSALKLQPDFPSAHWNIGLIHLMRGEYAKGWPLYEWRWKTPGLGFGKQRPGAMWDGGPLNGKRILIHDNQGFGDVIQFSRYLPFVLERGGKIVLSCESGLHALMSGNWKIDELIDADAEKLPEYDVQCPLASLPLLFGTTLETIPNQTPYIKANHLVAEKWRSRVEEAAAGRKKVGLVWAGRRMPDPLRATTPVDMAALADVKGVWFCSLQLGEKSETLGFDVTDWTDELYDFADTAGLIANLDTVVTVDTAVAHLAGAMDKPTWVLLKQVPDWRWMMGRTDSPWYPSMRLFRQENSGDWRSPVRRIADELAWPIQGDKLS